jgi:hypothetical protein
MSNVVERRKKALKDGPGCVSCFCFGSILVFYHFALFVSKATSYLWSIINIPYVYVNIRKNDGAQFCDLPGHSWFFVIICAKTRIFLFIFLVHEVKNIHYKDSYTCTTNIGYQYPVDDRNCQ